MPTVFQNNLNLYYEVHGAGAPLVLVAGLASDSQSWQPIVDDLAEHFTVILFDNRCSGRTTPQDIDTSIQDIADDCIALIHYLGFSRVNLLGHSMGGFVALDCAIRYPAFISNLILAATSAFNPERNNALFRDWAAGLASGVNLETWFRTLFSWIFTKRFFEDRATVEIAVRYAMDYPYPKTPLGFRKQVDAISNFSCLETLDSISARTLVISGKEDILFPALTSREILQAIPEASFSIVADAAHSVHMEKPLEFVTIIRDFLSDIS